MTIELIRVDFTKEDFLLFCTLFEQELYQEFKPSLLKETPAGLEYTATYRDEFNYKIPVKLYLSKGHIHWDYVTRYDEVKKKNTVDLDFEAFVTDVYETFLAKLQKN
jgi:hypothetical protein